jgi:hypothetical protein
MEEALRLAFEQTTTGNLKGVVEYTKETRKLVRKMEEQIKGFEKLLLTREADIVELRRQLSILQSKLYLEGTN